MKYPDNTFYVSQEFGSMTNNNKNPINKAKVCDCENIRKVNSQVCACFVS